MKKVLVTKKNMLDFALVDGRITIEEYKKELEKPGTIDKSKYEIRYVAF